MRVVGSGSTSQLRCAYDDGCVIYVASLRDGGWEVSIPGHGDVTERRHSPRQADLFTRSDLTYNPLRPARAELDRRGVKEQTEYRPMPTAVPDDERSTLRNIFEKYINLTAKVRGFVGAYIDSLATTTPSSDPTDVRSKILRFWDSVQQIDDTAKSFWRNFTEPDTATYRNLNELTKHLAALVELREQLSTISQASEDLARLRDQLRYVLDSCWITTMGLYDSAGNDVRSYMTAFFDRTVSQTERSVQMRTAIRIPGIESGSINERGH